MNTNQMQGRKSNNVKSARVLRTGLFIAMVSLGLAACNNESGTSAMANPAAMPSTTAPASRESSSASNNIPAPIVCSTCGTVRSITAITTAGQGTGVGAAIGAIAGGLAGNQIGGGSGKTVATAAGVIGGAVAGNAIEKNRRSGVSYDVVIAMDNGDERVISVPDVTGIAVGSQVTVQGTDIYQR